ncbi:MAG: hypothetical protein KBD37_09980 [Burkholderiales bacterium]|nr:hypothetical protein [Burkholderiales bacterium]
MKTVNKSIAVLMTLCLLASSNSYAVTPTKIRQANNTFQVTTSVNPLNNTTVAANAPKPTQRNLHWN